MKRALIWCTAALAACAGAFSGYERPDPCPGDTTVYAWRDTSRGVIPAVMVKSTMPRGGMSRTTTQGVVGPTGRIESGSIRSFGGDPEERLAAGDALFWSRFHPATRDGCAVRFLYRVTYMSGIPQRLPDEVPDTTRD